MSLGFREISSYFIIFQLYFKFMNEWTEMQGELNPKIKEQIDYIKNLNKINEKKG